MKEQFYNLLSALCATFAPSGCECRMAEQIQKELQGIGECYTDKKGNVICHLPGSGRKTAVISAMDETSFMVTDIDGDGYIRIAPTGTADPGCFLGKKMAVGNEEIVYHGIGGGKVLHLTSGAERSDNPSFEKYFIDLGTVKKKEKKENTKEAESDKEEEEESISIEKGDFAAFEAESYTLPGDFFVGKALEARTGVAIAIESAKAEAQKPVGQRKDLYYLFTVKDKADRSGAVTAGYAIDPEDAIILSHAPSNAFDGVDEHLKSAVLGNGVAIAMKDGKVLFYDSPLFRKAICLAEENHIPYQKTDGNPADSAGALHLGREGVCTLSLRIPCYNPETSAVIIKKQDVDAVYKLLTALLD